ncbi:MAG: phosphate ABC transporter ATP-binding protein PstB [Coriobacteriia bacterium]|nr:phosphate ABC transporter ATP-binding protein PstB [Coriobacteriia bacterium]
MQAAGVSSWYGSNQVLKDVDICIPQRRITALIGPSGCGKSTFLRCVNRMNDLIRGFRMQGTVSVHGEDINGPQVDVTLLRRTVGMVFQHPNPFPMSVYDNIALAVREHKPSINRDELDGIVEQSLKDAHLWDEVKDRLSGSALGLSGGQQQRLCIARALAVKPEVLMLDEPCASLDPIATGKIEELLLQLRERYTIIIVTHNLAQARRISDEMAFFLMGEMLEQGPTQQVLAAPQREETAAYLDGSYG